MQTGEVVQLGRHRLLCGDAFNPEHVDALMHGAEPDVLYCDPPYGMRYESTPNGMTGYGIAPLKAEKSRAVRGDESDFDPRFLMERFKDCKEQFWWGADYYAERIPNRNDGAWIIWDKRLSDSGDKMFGSAFEQCWSRVRHKRDMARIQWAGIFGLNGEPDRKRHHPTQKPVALAEWFISRYSKPDALVLDLFGGAGGTLLACERMNRRACVMEISLDYCEVIIQRYEQMAQQPKLLEVS